MLLDPLVQLARQTIEAWVRSGRLPQDPGVPVLPELRRPGACFVSLHRRGELRGCIGTLEPCHASLGAEIRENAVAACSRDRRFPPLEAGELQDLEVKVDVLSPLESVEGVSALDPRRFGVVVEDDAGRRGVLLPDLEGVDSPGQQLAIARRKAGIPGDEKIRIQRFTVERHT
ncbi:MAG: AmmeMemoRadiSam system protein A [Acidobacteria bacterium]|nr:AmmeMemoRadiSam system protein A [Acidobacteriota bacterium]